jgi:hypothetical protein
MASPRQFTRQEAEEMLPYLAPLLFKLRGLRQEQGRLQEEAARIGASMRTNGHGLAEALRKAQAETQEIAGQIGELVERINEMGCELKDVDMGLIDFRTTMEGREVYLCWRLGEEHIAHWHDLDAGFGGRRPLEGAGD